MLTHPQLKRTIRKRSSTDNLLLCSRRLTRLAAFHNETSVHAALFYQSLIKLKYHVSKAFLNARHVGYTLAGLSPSPNSASRSTCAVSLATALRSYLCVPQSSISISTRWSESSCNHCLNPSFFISNSPLLGALFLDVYKTSFPSQLAHLSSNPFTKNPQSKTFFTPQ